MDHQKEVISTRSNRGTFCDLERRHVRILFYGGWWYARTARLTTIKSGMQIRVGTGRVVLRVWYGMVWYGIVEFNVPLDTVQVISKTGALEQWCAPLVQ